MTSDAKIGLLLGLVFIFIIAFVINGLPRFQEVLGSEDNYVNRDIVQDNVIAEREREAEGLFVDDIPEVGDYPGIDDDDGIELADEDYGYPSAWSEETYYPDNSHAGNRHYPNEYSWNNSRGNYEEEYSDYPEIVFNDNQPETEQIDTPQENSIEEEIRNDIPFMPAFTDEEVPTNGSGPGGQPGRGGFLNRNGNPFGGRNQMNRRQGGGFNSNTNNGPNFPFGAGQNNRQPQNPSGSQNTPGNSSNNESFPKNYEIQEGDNNLAKIAKKFYGEEEGNRIVNVDIIFEANKDVLKSRDKIFVGQKIVIPKPAPPEVKNQPSDILNSEMFKQVQEIGGRRQDTGKWYKVQDGDSLWKIAKEQLGNGARFTELSELNSDILTDKNELKLGMMIRLPKE